MSRPTGNLHPRKPRHKVDGLTQREAAFAHSYVHDEPNGTRAAVKAGYSKKTAHVAGSRLLKRIKVKAEIARLRDERAARTAVTTDTVIARLNREAEGLGPDTTAATRVRALELLGRHLGMFREKLNVEAGGSGGNQVQVVIYIPDNGRDKPGVPDDDDDEGDDPGRNALPG